MIGDSKEEDLVSFLSKYEIGGLIVEGETRTSKGREVSSGREVLIHELPGGSDRTRGMDLLRMIHRNLRSLAPTVRNPILELGEHEGRMYLVTEPIPAFSSLRSWLEGGLTTGSREPEVVDKSPAPVAPLPARSGEATMVGPAPVTPAAARTQVVKVAPREWVFASAQGSPTSEPVGTNPADVTPVGPFSPAPSPSAPPVREAEPAATVIERLLRPDAPQPSRAGSDDVTMVGLAAVDAKAVPSDATASAPVGSRAGPALAAAPAPPTMTGTGLFEATQVMPQPLQSGSNEVTVVGSVPARAPALSDKTLLAPAGSIPGATVETGSPRAATGTGLFEATQVMPSAGAAWEKERGAATGETPPHPWTTIETEGGKPSPPPPEGEFTMVLGGPSGPPASEPHIPPAAPAAKADGSTPGEFTGLVQAPPPAASSTPPSNFSSGAGGPPSGDFTRMFGGICAPSGPGDRGPEAGSRAFARQPEPDIFASPHPPPVASGPASVSSELPEGFGARPAGEFTKIFGAPGATGPLNSGLGPDERGYTDKPQPGEFTQIFGRQGRAVPGREASAGFPPGSSAGLPEIQRPGSSPQPSGPASGAPPSGAPPAAASPEFKLPEIKPPKPPSVPAAPKIPAPPPAAAGKLPKPPSFAPPAKPAMPAAPKIPPPPKIPAAPALKPKTPAAATKVPKPRKSYLPLVLILGGLLVLATAMVLYFAFAGH